jgi:putative SOS response-associated peptidase YedK
MRSAKKRAARIEAKRGSVDFKALLGIEPDGGTTNIRNVNRKHWQRWLGVENRCVVPFTSFSSTRRQAVPSPHRLCRDLDALDLSAQGQGRRDDQRSIPLSVWSW